MRWLILVVLLSSHALAQESDWLTYYEKSNYKKTPRYDETIAYCKRLAQASPWLHFTTFGKSTQGRDLPLVIADRAGQFDSELVRATDRVVLLIQAGI
ncbi:MAG: peptidase M14, partial [bacterium]